jgi:hypothetical protein
MCAKHLQPSTITLNKEILLFYQVFISESHYNQLLTLTLETCCGTSLFGVFLFCTIGFSLLFSLGMFTLLMGLCGPENNNGCLKTLFAKLRDKCRKQKEEKVKYSEANVQRSPLLILPPNTC